jgi:hypothetical protein
MRQEVVRQPWRFSPSGSTITDDMLEADAILPAAHAAAEQLGSVDIALGMPGVGDGADIAHVLEMARAGLSAFPSRTCVIIEAEAESHEAAAGEAPSVVKADSLIASGPSGDQAPVLRVLYPVDPVEKLVNPYDGTPGKSSAFRTILQTATQLKAKACVIVDTDPSSITARGVEHLVRPVLEEDFDFVAPRYQRHKFEGTINSGLVYPLTRALYGKRIRQPGGRDFALSPRLREHLLRQDIWRPEAIPTGMDTRVTTVAVCGGYRLCEAAVGAQIYSARDQGTDLSDILAQGLGALFSEMEARVAVWQRIRGSERVPFRGDPVPVDTAPVTVNVRSMSESFRLGYDTLQEIWQLVLPPMTLLELKRASRLTPDRFRFSDEVWARTVYDFAMGYRQRVIGRNHLLRALTPLYLGWLGSFILQMEDADAETVEARLERLCLTYEAQKPYLISRWRWPDRFNP